MRPNTLAMKSRLLLACILVVSLLNACGGGSNSKAGFVRLVNAASDYSTLDLYASSTNVSSGIASYAVGSYAELNANTTTFNLKSGGSSATAATLSGEVSKQKHSTIVAYTTGGTLTTTYLSDEEGAPSSGTAKLRVFHTDASDAGNVDVYLIDSACSGLNTVSAAATASAVSGLQAVYTEIAAAAGGTSYHVCVTAAGDKSDLRLDIPAATFTNQQVTTLILTRTPGGVLLHGLLLDQQGALTKGLNNSARVRFAVSTSNIGTIATTVNGVSLGLPGVSGAIGPYTPVPAGALSVKINAAAATVSAPALAGADYTLLVTGPVNAPVATLIADDNTVSTSTVRPVKLRLLNGLNGAAVAATLAKDSNLVGTALFATASASAQVEASAALASLVVTAEGSNALQVNNSTTLTLTSGKVYTVFLFGPAAAAPGIPALRQDR